MSGHRVRKIINERRLAVAEIWSRDRNQTQADIIKALKAEYGIKASQVTISTDLKALGKITIDRTAEIVREVKREIFAEYQYIYGQALKAWLATLEPTIETVTETVVDGHTERAKVYERVSAAKPNPALLAQARGALKDIRELYGIDPAGPGESDESPIVVKVIKGVSTDDL